jgi:hypothetical protein
VSLYTKTEAREAMAILRLHRSTLCDEVLDEMEGALFAQCDDEDPTNDQ